MQCPKCRSQDVRRSHSHWWEWPILFCIVLIAVEVAGIGFSDYGFQIDRGKLDSEPMSNEEHNNLEEALEPITGQDELLYSVGAAIRHKPTKDAVAKLLEGLADDVPRRAALRKQWLWHSTFLIAFTLLLIAILGWQKIISAEATAALLGGLLGYVFGRQSRG